MRIKLALALLMTLAMGAERVAAETPKKAELAAGYAAHLVDLVNQYRQRHHLPQLLLDDRLIRLAQEHAVDMANQRRLSHDGFDGRFKRANRELCVENVGWNYRNAKEQLKGWRNSPGHNVNLLNAEVRRVGIAIVQGYVSYFACTA